MICLQYGINIGTKKEEKREEERRWVGAKLLTFE